MNQSPLKPVPLRPRYALPDEPCPDGWVWIAVRDADSTERRRLLIPIARFGNAFEQVRNATPAGEVPPMVTILDVARHMTIDKPELRELDEYDFDQPSHICAAIVAEADPPGHIVVGREAAEAEGVPDGYAEVHTEDGARLFVLTATKPFVFRGVVAGDLPTPIVRFTDADPVEYEGKAYRTLTGFAYPPMSPYSADPIDQVRVLVQLGAPVLGEQPRIGFYPSPDQSCPDGYTEVTDSRGKRAFLDSRMVATVATGEQWTGAGPSLLDNLAENLVTATVAAVNDIAATFEAAGIPTVNRSPEAMAARADVEATREQAAATASAAAAPGVPSPPGMVTVPADVFTDLVQGFTEASAKLRRVGTEVQKVKAAYEDAGDNRLWDAAREMIDNIGDESWDDRAGDMIKELVEAVGAAYQEREAAITALSYVTADDPLPPADFHTHPWAMDMMASLKRARDERGQAQALERLAKGMLNSTYSERNAALAAVAWLGIRTGLVRAGVAENGDGSVDPENPGWDLLYLDVPTMRPGPAKPERIGFHFGPDDKDKLRGLPRDPGIVPDEWSKEEDQAVMSSFLDWLAYKPSGPVMFVDPSSARQ